MTRRRAARASPTGSAGARPRRPTRSRARPTRTAARPSIWDTFAPPGRVRAATRATSPRDHYHRYRDDVALHVRPRPRRLPVLGRLAARQARRAPARSTSAAWTSTTGWSTSCWRPASSPMVTLYHWDLPQALRGRGRLGQPRHRRSGSPTTRPWSTTRSATACATWTTLNEPWCSAFLGYASGVHAPGRRRPGRRRGRGTPPAAGPRPRGRGDAGARPGTGWASSSTCTNVHATDDAEVTHDAARRADGLHNRWFLDGVFERALPRGRPRRPGRPACRRGRPRRRPRAHRDPHRLAGRELLPGLRRWRRAPRACRSRARPTSAATA